MVLIRSHHFLNHVLNYNLGIFIVEFVLELLDGFLEGNARRIFSTNQILCILGPLLPQLLFFLGDFCSHVVFLCLRVIYMLLCLVLSRIFHFVFNTCFGRGS